MKFETRVIVMYMGYIWPFSVESHLSFSALVSKWPVTWNWLVVEWNWRKFGTNGSYMYLAYLWPFSVQGHFGVIQCTCLKMAHNSKTSDRKGKLIKIWDSGRSYLFYYMCVGYLWPFSFHGYFWGHLGTLVSKWYVTRNEQAIGWNWNSWFGILV